MYMKVAKMSKRWRSFHAIWLSMVMLCFVQCKESSDGNSVVDFDPSKPITVTDFLPKEGGSGSNLVIYGENFGNDVSRIKVVIGGKIAKVISVKGNALYCIVPAQAYDGDIKVSVLDQWGEDELTYGEASDVFAYQRKLVVTDLAGTYYEVASQRVQKQGPFHDAGAFDDMLWFSFDPLESNHLYVMAGTSASRKVDLSAQYVSYFLTPGVNRKNTMTWRLDGNRDMMVFDDIDNSTSNTMFIFSRSSNFTAIQQGGTGQGVTGSAVHPVNGELYYAMYRVGQVWRRDFTTGENRLAVSNPFSSTSIYIVIHPSGDYAYLTNHHRHTILRTDYNYATKTFQTPYVVAGQGNSANFVDDIGTNARLNWPVQGVFVKNPDYEGNGGDQYDYYFCDRNNHAVRRLTPQGRVSTFAGRGNNGTSGYANGDLRLEARFNQPTAIAYDEARECFYIGDSMNRIIRKIGFEE